MLSKRPLPCLRMPPVLAASCWRVLPLAAAAATTGCALGACSLGTTFAGCFLGTSCLGTAAAAGCSLGSAASAGCSLNGAAAAASCRRFLPAAAAARGCCLGTAAAVGCALMCAATAACCLRPLPFAAGCCSVACRPRFLVLPAAGTPPCSAACSGSAAAGRWRCLALAAAAAACPLTAGCACTAAAAGCRVGCCCRRFWPLDMAAAAWCLLGGCCLGFVAAFSCRLRFLPAAAAATAAGCSWGPSPLPACRFVLPIAAARCRLGAGAARGRLSGCCLLPAGWPPPAAASALKCTCTCFSFFCRLAAGSAGSMERGRAGCVRGKQWAQLA